MSFISFFRTIVFFMGALALLSFVNPIYASTCVDIGKYGNMTIKPLEKLTAQVISEAWSYCKIELLKGKPGNRCKDFQNNLNELSNQVNQVTDWGLKQINNCTHSNTDEL